MSTSPRHQPRGRVQLGASLGRKWSVVVARLRGRSAEPTDESPSTHAAPVDAADHQVSYATAGPNGWTAKCHAQGCDWSAGPSQELDELQRLSMEHEGSE